MLFPLVFVRVLSVGFDYNVEGSRITLTSSGELVIDWDNLVNESLDTITDIIIAEGVTKIPKNCFEHFKSLLELIFLKV